MIDNLQVIYQVDIYNGDSFQCSYETEYPKELKDKVKASKELASRLGINEVYKYFIRTYKDNKPCELYEVTEREIV